MKRHQQQRVSINSVWCAAFPTSDRGYCDCGTCECDEGWFGDACQFQEDCNLPSKKSKELCKNPQGVICSNRGTVTTQNTRIIQITLALFKATQCNFIGSVPTYRELCAAALEQKHLFICSLYIKDVGKSI